MSIKVKVGGGRSIKAIPKQDSTTPIVAPAERKPQIVPDSVVLGIDTIGPYIQCIDAGNGIIVFPETDVELANVVISHANTSSEISTNNDILSFTRNVDIDAFGHVTQFYNTSLSSLNFTANNSLIQAKDFTIGTTSLTIGESTSTLEGLSSISVDGQSTFGSVNVTDLTPTRIVYVGTDGELVDSQDLTFTGSNLSVNNSVVITGTLNASSQVTAASLNVQDLTPTRITYAGPNGELVDSANLVFDGTSLIATGGVLLGGLDVSGQTTLDSVNVQDLTPTRIVYAGIDGELVDSANLTFDGVSLTATGGVFLDGLEVQGQSTLGSVNVEDLTPTRIVYVGTDGELVDSANLIFNGVSLIATGGVFLDDLSVPGQSTFGSVNILDLTEGRVFYAGANGELIDSANLTFDGVSLTATGGVFLDVLQVPGQAEFGSVEVNDLTQNRVVFVGPSGALVDSNKLTFDGSTFVVDGDADITGNITIGGNIILGDAPIDTINVVADFTSDIIPDASDLYSLGTIGKNWYRVYTPTIKSDTGVVTIAETGALTLPVGSTGDRPTAATGMVRYNTSDNRFEGYDGAAWSELAGSVKDVNKDTFIRAETAPGDNNDQLDFFNNGVQSLQLDSDGDFKYGAGLNKVVIDHATGDTKFEGTVVANNQVTAASLNVLDLVTSGIVTTGPNGELRNSANLSWDGFTLTIVGGISVDGDFSTSGGLSGDSLSVGNLQANTMMFVSDTGALSSNNNIKFDGTHMTVNATSAFLTAPTIETVGENQVFVAGANGALEGDSNLTWNGSTLDVNGQAAIASVNVEDLTSGRIVLAGTNGELEDDEDLTWDGTTLTANGDVAITGALTIGDGATFGGDQVTVPSLNVLDLTQGRVTYAGANGELVDSANLVFDGTTFTVDGDVDITGDVSIGGNLTLGNQTLDTINVVADFTSDLIPKDDNTYDIGETGSNWRTLYVRNLTSDIDVVKVTANGAFTVPVGSTSDRPTNLEAGMVRFNSSDGVFEGYSGSAWASLGGVKDVDQDTYIQAESSPGADNDELEFYTAGTRRFYVSNTGVITTDANTDLVFEIGSNNFNVGNSIITGVQAPVNSSDAVNKDYLENTYERDLTVANGGNTHIIALLANNPKITLDPTLTVTGYDAGNNEITIGLDPVWQSFTGLRDAGPEGFIPNFEFDVYGRVRSLINVPLSVSSNAVVDFANSIFDVITDAVRNGNTEEGITVTANTASTKLNFSTNNFDIDLTGAVTGSGTVVHNSNVSIATSFDYPTLDARYLNVEGGDTANGDLGATKFVDKADTDYYVWPSNTSRIRNIIVGYGYNESSIQMSTGPTSFQYIYATATRIGYLSNNFNFGTYFDTTNNSWKVTDGSVYSRNFIDSQNENYLLNPAGNNSRFLGLNLDQSVVIGSNLTVSNNDITTASGDLVLNPFSGIIDANTSIITNVVDPVNSLDAVNKQYLQGEVNSITSLISALSANGISIAANTGSTDVVALGDTIIFAGGPGIDTIVSNNQILISGNASGILDLVKTVDGAGSGLDADLLDGANGTYYLDYTNFTNTPTDTDILNQIKNVDGAGSGLDADLLDGQSGAYYLDYNNFTSTPSNTDILEAVKNVDGSGSGLDADLLDGLDSTQFLRSDEDDTFDGNLIITGNLTVTGNTTYVNTEEILLSDNVIVLNANFTGPTASENAGIEVERGDETNVVLQWNEAQNYWEIAAGGTIGRILTTGDEGSGNGLDSDTLDGQEGTYYLDFTNFTNIPDPQIDVTLSGKVTGVGTTTLTNLGNGSISITTELANTAVVAGSYGSASEIPVFTVDEDGRLTAATTATVAGVSDTYWTIANNTFTIETVDGGVYNTVIDEFTDITVNGNVVVTGTVDGRDIAADGAKLDGIEAGATGDMSASEILAELLTVDGAGSGLDADLLDGANSTFYLDYNNFFNVPAASFDLTLTGKVTGTAFSNSGIMTLTTELANTGVTAGTYGTASQIPVITVDEDGRITAASNVAVAGVSDTYWSVANNTYTIETVDGGAYNTVIDEFTGLTVNGNITVTGLVDGRDIAADGAKLDLLEDGLDLTLTGKVTGTASSNTGVMTLVTELANTGVTAGTYGSASAIPVIVVDEDGRITSANTQDVAGVQGIGWYTANNTFEIQTVDGSTFQQQIDTFGDTIDTSNIVVTGLVDGRDVSVDGAKLDTIESGAQVNLSNTEILEAIKTVDGAGSGLDADTVDGYQASELLSQAANTAAANVGDGTITLTANNGLSGFGTFNLNDFGNTDISIEHADTSSVSDVDNSNGNVLQDITFDTFGHVQTVGSVDLDGRYYTEAELDAGQLDSRYYTETELNNGQLDTRYYTETELNNGQLDSRYYTETEVDTLLDGKVDNTVNILAGDGLSGGGALTANVTISHGDTSSQANTSFAGNEFVTAINLDTYGHVVGVTKETRSFLTQADADARYVNVDGDTMTGNLTVEGFISQEHSALASVSATTATIFATQIWSFDAATYNSAEIIITATQGINRHITKLLVAHNGSTASATEFGTIYTNTSLANYEVGLSGGNVTLSSTPANGTTIEYKIAATLIID